MVLCSYFAIVKNHVIWSLIFIIIEFGFLIYFLASHFPGGIEGVSYFFKYVW